MRQRFLLFVLLTFIVFLFAPLLIFAQVPVALAPVPAQQFLSSTGAPLAGGCVFTYVSGTTTPQATYTDGTGSVPNTNPIILDIGGFGNIWLANVSYRFVIYSSGGVNCATGSFQRTVDNISAYSIINQAQNIFLSCGTSDPVGAAGELGCRSDLSNKMRYFSLLWDSVVTESVAATLTNKTLQGPTINIPVINGQSTGTGVQGNDSRLLSVDNSGVTGSPYCKDANGGATTIGCMQLPEAVFNQSPGATQASIVFTTMFTPTVTATFRFSAAIDQTITGTSCAGNSTYSVQASWTDPNGVAATDSLAWIIAGPTLSLTQAIVNNGTVGRLVGPSVPINLRAKVGTPIQYAVTVTPNGSCAPAPTYQIFPLLEQMSFN